MPDLPETRDSLLLRLRDPENLAAWEEFVEIYQPVVYRTGLAKGLQHADALDLVQTVFISIAGSISNWEAKNENSRFRYWLLRVARNATINAITRKAPDRAAGGTAVTPELQDLAVDHGDSETRINLEYRRQLYHHAAKQVRGEVNEATWQAFELTAVKDMPIEQAARETGMSVGAIYGARSRIMKRLSGIVAKLEEAYQ